MQRVGSRSGESIAPPDGLVGRGFVRSALADQLREPLPLWVVGPPGVGKTALLKVALRELPCVIWLRAPSADLLGELSAELGVAAEEQAVLSGAEKRRAVVVLDDADRAPRALLEACESLARSAEEARWLFVAPSAPPNLAASVRLLRVEPLAAGDIRALAEAARPGSTEAELQAVALAADGIPRRALVCVASLDVAPTSERLEGLSDEVVRHLAVMQLGPKTGGEQRRAPAEPTARTNLREFEEHVRSARHEAALEALEQFPAWIEAGLGEQAWAALRPVADPRFDSLKLRLASALHSRASLAWLGEQPRPSGEAERRLWIEALHQGGETRRAIAELEELLESTSRRSARVELQISLAQVLCDAGQPGRAARLLRGVHPDVDVQRARRSVQLARALYHWGDASGCVDTLEQLRALIADLPDPVGREFDAERRSILMLLGQTGALESGAASPSAGGGRGLRNLVFYSLRLAISGRPLKSASVLASLGSSLPASGGVLVQLASGVVAVIRGDYRGLPESSRSLVREAEQTGNASLYHGAFLLERAVNLARPHLYPELPWSDVLPPPRGVMGRHLQGLRVCHAARRGEPVDPAEIPQPQPGDGPFMEPVCALAAAIVHLLGGASESPAFDARQAAERAADHGYHFFRAEALLIQCYAELAAGQTEALREALGTLAELARSTRSRRYEVIHRLLSAALHSQPDPACLLAVAAEGDASPTAARVASCLLGAPPDPDALDRLLVDGLRRAWDHGVRPLDEGEAASWLIEPEARRVHFDGRSVAVSPQGLRVLLALFEQGGQASVAELAHAGWGIEEFHQLRDSKRVHVAVRRLRTQVEPDPSEPRFVLTTAAGYEFASSSPPGLLA